MAFSAFVIPPSFWIGTFSGQVRSAFCLQSRHANCSHLLGALSCGGAEGGGAFVPLTYPLSIGQHVLYLIRDNG